MFARAAWDFPSGMAKNSKQRKTQRNRRIIFGEFDTREKALAKVKNHLYFCPENKKATVFLPLLFLSIRK